MSTKIEWCTETWNPIVGCSKVSPGCDNCYAERMAKRLAGINPLISKYKFVVGNTGWNGRTSMEFKDFDKPLKWKKPRMIFVCSMGDLFHESVPFDWIVNVWEVMIKTPHHTYLILTKRPQRALEFTQWFAKETAPVDGEIFPVLPHVWLGVTAENQEQANIRVPILLSTPAAKRFVSAEPLLEQIDLVNVYGSEHKAKGTEQLGFIDWVICGGESGPGARPMHPEWVRFLQAECHCCRVPFFFKQWGEWLPAYDFDERLNELVNDFPKCRIGRSYDFPDGTAMYKIGKRAAGSLLDGKEYKEYPESVL